MMFTILVTFSFCTKQSYKNMINIFHLNFSWHFFHLFNLLLFSLFLICYRDCILGTCYSLFSQLWWLLVQEVLIWASLLSLGSIYYNFHLFTFCTFFLSSYLPMGTSYSYEYDSCEESICLHGFCLHTFGYELLLCWFYGTLSLSLRLSHQSFEIV